MWESHDIRKARNGFNVCLSTDQILCHIICQDLSNNQKGSENRSTTLADCFLFTTIVLPFQNGSIGSRLRSIPFADFMLFSGNNLNTRTTVSN